MTHAARPVVADGARAKPALLMVGVAESCSYVKAGSASGSGVEGILRRSIARKLW
jgi:hypothetical protein